MRFHAPPGFAPYVASAREIDHHHTKIFLASRAGRSSCTFGDVVSLPRHARYLAPLVAVVVAAACAASDSVGAFTPVSDDTETGGAAGAVGARDGGARDATLASADAGALWPDAAPDAAVDAGPSPAFDAGPPPAFTCGGKAGPSGTRTLVVQSGGVVRTTILHVPASLDPTKGATLVLNFHGFSSANWQQELLTHMTQAADERGFIVAYPEGVASSWNAGDCCGTSWVDAIDDVAFTRDLLDAIQADHCVDPARVFATGMSNGGFFSHRLACDLSDRIAAISPVSGVLGVDPGACNPKRHVPILHFHGTADPIVPYGGGAPIVPQLGVGVDFVSVAASMEAWRAKNQCAVTPTTFFQHGDATCVEWEHCTDGATTALCTIDGGGHTWPGGLPIPAGKTSSDIDATAAMLQFFDAHPMKK